MSQSLLVASATLGGASNAPRPRRVSLAGIQISPAEILDEGIEACLDFVQEHGAVNALFCYSQTYHLGESPLNVLATDHPRSPRDPTGRNLPYLWMRLPAAAFSGLSVRHEAPRHGAEYADRDLFAELAEPCRRRGLKLYARILEAGSQRANRIPGYAKVAAVGADGAPSHGPCWNHPDYREWIRRTVEEMMRHYPLDGLQYGAERVGSLSEVLFKGGRAACFCEHCRARNRAAGIDVDGVALGFARLEALMGAVAGGARPADGVLTEVIRVLFRHPEMLAFYEQWLRADTEIQRMVYEAAKSIRPEAEVGQHVDHQRSSWDILYRAAVSYADMAEHNDFIKPILYHEILGPRLREWVIDEMRKRVLADFSEDAALSLFYAAFGHDPAREPVYADLLQDGLSPDYVFRETLRCVQGVAGKAKVYAGIGLDVPHYIPGGMKPVPSRPESVYEATRQAFQAGADGVLASREYREMTRPSLRAFGRAVREQS